MRTLSIQPNDAGQRLDKFLTKYLKNLPQSLLYKYVRTKKIKVNRKRAEPNSVLCAGDTIELFIKEEFFPSESPAYAFKTISPALDIVYEDENILLCNKKPGVLVHQGDDEEEELHTLINHIKAYLYQKGTYQPEEELSFVPALCNRIDRNTGGIVIAAKNAVALRLLNEKIKNNEISKYYLCIAHGIFSKKSDTLSGFLQKDKENNIVKIYSQKYSQNPAIKNILTKYRVIEEKNKLSLLEVELITGRTHQIRAHFASIGHPLLGDGKYGINKEDRKIGYQYQALYSYRLVFHCNNKTDELAYLDGKSFQVNPEKIWFLQDFSALSAISAN